MSVDTSQIYNILLAKNYQEEIFSELPTRRIEKQGRELVKDCPYCGKEAHFYVSTEKPLYNCFKCQASGDWIKYLQEQKGLSFLEALKQLSEAAGVKLEGFDEKQYKAKERRATLLEEANRLFRKSLRSDKGQEVYNYLKQERGYSEEDIEALELGAYRDREELKRYLQEKGFSEEEVKQAGLFSAGLGITHTLAVLWRDASGRALGITGRTLLSDKEREGKGLSKYVNSAGLERSKSFLGLERVRKGRDALLVEGVLDALLLNSKGLEKISGAPPAIALGGTKISSYQLETLQQAGVTDLVIALDNDEPGQAATEELITSMLNSGVNLYVLELPSDVKDIGELLQKGRGFDETEPVSWSKWLPRRIFSKYQTSSDIGYRKALDDALKHLANTEKLDRQNFTEALIDLSGLNMEMIEEELSGLREASSQEKIGRELELHRSRLERLGAEEAEAELEKTLSSIRKLREVDKLEPYFYNEYEKTLEDSPLSLETGFKVLDSFVSIPQGAITVIAGRPRHGKTTLMLNMMLRMIEKYPERSFYFFSYELPANKLVTMLLMTMSKHDFNDRSGRTNFDCFEKYVKYGSKDIKEIEAAKEKYKELSSSGRLYLIDKAYSERDLQRLITATANSKETGAVFVDYLQKIPLEASASQRYVEVKHVLEALRKAAVACSIPIIAGAQLGRGVTGEPRLENLRESGDIEQDATVVLALHNKKTEEQDSEASSPGKKRDKVSSLKIILLKSRLGEDNRHCEVGFNGSIFSIISD